MRKITLEMKEVCNVDIENLTEHEVSEYIHTVMQYIKRNYHSCICDEYEPECEDNSFEYYYEGMIVEAAEDVEEGRITYLYNWQQILDLMMVLGTCDLIVEWLDGVFYVRGI